MQLSTTQYEAFLAADKNLTVTGGGVLQLAGCFVFCEGPFYDGQSFSMQGVGKAQIVLKEVKLEVHPDCHP